MYCCKIIILKIICCYNTIKTFFSKNCTNKDIISIPIEFTDKKMYNHGFYSSVFVVNKQTKQISTFFPSDWTKERVMESIHEAHNDFIARNENPIPNKDGIYIVHGFTKEDIKIELYINCDGDECIVDRAYPLFE